MPTDSRETEWDMQQAKFVKANYDEMDALPNGIFSHHAVTVTPQRLDYCVDMGLLTVAVDGARYNTGNSITDVNCYHKRPVLDAILASISSPSKIEMPCGCHGGIENIGEFIQCKQCNGRFLTEEVR